VKTLLPAKGCREKGRPEEFRTFIEQGGTSLYPTLALKASGEEVLRILLSIGGVEITISHSGTTKRVTQLVRRWRV
jgi:hypothetical protein